jgi:hypothetical protein
MKVICKDNYHYYRTNNKHNLIVGKTYNVISCVGLRTNTFYRIVCEDGLQRNIISTRFITLELHREQIINEVLK